jgi:ABC-type antimicrobial peptide transport system permease subunit
VAVVSEAFAREHLAGGEPLGRRLGWDAAAKQEVEVVGVVADAKVWSLREDARPVVYLPLAQEESVGAFSLQVRLRRGALGQLPELVRDLARADPALQVVHAATLEESVRSSLRQERLLATLTGVFGAMALALTVVGLFGSMAFAAARRVREIGVRMALGATRSRVVRMLLRETALVLAGGLASGLLLAAVAVRSLGSLLFGLTPWDPVAFAGAAAVLAVAGLLGALAPARAAASRSPAEALRHE